MRFWWVVVRLSTAVVPLVMLVSAVADWWLGTSFLSLAVGFAHGTQLLPASFWLVIALSLSSCAIVMARSRAVTMGCRICC